MIYQKTSSVVKVIMLPPGEDIFILGFTDDDKQGHIFDDNDWNLEYNCLNNNNFCCTNGILVFVVVVMTYS